MIKKIDGILSNRDIDVNIIRLFNHQNIVLLAKYYLYIKLIVSFLFSDPFFLIRFLKMNKEGLRKYLETYLKIDIAMKRKGISIIDQGPYYRISSFYEKIENRLLMEVIERIPLPDIVIFLNVSQDTKLTRKMLRDKKEIILKKLDSRKNIIETLKKYIRAMKKKGLAKSEISKAINFKLRLSPDNCLSNSQVIRGDDIQIIVDKVFEEDNEEDYIDNNTTYIYKEQLKKNELEKSFLMVKNVKFYYIENDDNNLLEENAMTISDIVENIYVRPGKVL